MLKRLQLVAIALGLCTAALAQQRSWTRNGNVVSLSSQGKDLKIEFCTPTMFRVRTSWNKLFEAAEPWMVVKYDWSPVPLTITGQKDFLLLKTAALTVKVHKSTQRIEVLTKEGKLLSSEIVAGGGSTKYGEVIRCTKLLAADEHFFGFGERMDFLDRRNKKVRLNVGRGKGQPHIIGAYNILEANYAPVPFFMSTNGYGIFFHNAYPTDWDMGSSRKDAYSFSAAGGELDYYFIMGPKLPSILDQYTTLTGKAPLMPHFAYGLHMGTYSGGTWGHEQHTSDKYVIELARKLRAMGIPVDLLWLDSTWRIFGENGGKGATSFEWRETFKDPEGMFDSLYAMNYKMVGLHLRPRFDNGKKIRLLDTAQQLKFTYPEGGSPGEFVNFFDSASVDFWWKRGVMRVASQGAMFLKTDEGSAFGGLANESDKTGPQGKDIAKLHNLFPLAYAKAPYEKFQQHNGIRGLNQTREGYAGIQRYPYIFAGDWPSEWQYFEPVIKAGLNIGLSGVGNWAHCMGGFEHVADPELYIRWVQFGMFSPVAMVFGMEHPTYKEPWGYGEDALRNFKKYDSLRYQLLPYIYSHAYNMHTSGMPLMQALVLQYQDDPNVYSISDQYLLGNELMVCPVTSKGAQTRTIYLPEGDWYDYWTGKKFAGKQYINALSPLDRMPIFVKSGAIVPMQPAVSYVGEKPIDTLTLHVYPGNGRFRLYEDDGKSLSYMDKEFSTTSIISQATASGQKISISKPEGRFVPSNHQYLVKFHSAIKPKQVFVNGTSLSENNNRTNANWQFDAAGNVLSVYTATANNAASVIEVRY
jgi:alpha-glucosidase (family GH31 glycosyl hydrolase)